MLAPARQLQNPFCSSAPLVHLPCVALPCAAPLCPADLSEVVTRVGLAETEVDMVDSLGVRRQAVVGLDGCQSLHALPELHAYAC